MSDKYILKGHEAVPVNDLMEWARMFENSEARIVGKTKVGNATVSTVFLGLDHSFGGERPLLFETMIFEGDQDGFCERYSTWEEAEQGHKAVVQKLEAGEAP